MTRSINEWFEVIWSTYQAGNDSGGGTRKGGDNETTVQLTWFVLLSLLRTTVHYVLGTGRHQQAVEAQRTAVAVGDFVVLSSLPIADVLEDLAHVGLVHVDDLGDLRMHPQCCQPAMRPEGSAPLRESWQIAGLFTAFDLCRLCTAGWSTALTHLRQPILCECVAGNILP